MSSLSSPIIPQSSSSTDQQFHQPIRARTKSTRALINDFKSEAGGDCHDQNLAHPLWSTKPISSQNYPHSDPDAHKAWIKSGRLSAEPIRSTPTIWSKCGGGLEVINFENGSIENVIILLITILAIGVRCWKIWRPDSVVFDEVHFGEFASKYIRSTFFMDVHPPLAKLLITLVGFLFGYDGKFDFKQIGNDYPSNRVPYVQMRLLPALLGVAVVPLSYLTMRIIGLRLHSALLGALLIIFENGLIIQSRFILLDSPLIFFTALSIFLHTGFCNEDAKRSFTRRWWIWLSLTGLSLGAVVSCKWIGLFTIATTGVMTIKQLWELLGDLRVPIPLLARSFLARFICLAIIPILFYIFTFQIHFWVLSNSGDGDAFMSSGFQQTLRGRWMPDTYVDVFIGSNVTIKHVNTLGGYLHSHPQPYPGGSKQQQITLYPHQDDNNVWTILGKLSDDIDIHNRKPPDYYLKNPRWVNATSLIRLHHVETDKRLHTHNIRAPVTEVDYQNEVSAYGFKNFPGDANDEWIVEIVSQQSDVVNDPISAQRLRTLRTKFRLRHSLQNCYLFSHKVRLPNWGFNQQEVTCNQLPTLTNSLWYIETSTHPLLRADKKATKVNYPQPNFFAKFWELQRVMYQTNKALVEHHAYDSRPISWPLFGRGINYWMKDHRQVYLIGNPFVWWLAVASLGVYAAFKTLLILRTKRGYLHEMRNPTVSKYDRIAEYLTIGWAHHYLPFFLMTRQLFIHHYFPALYYSIFLVCTVFDLATSKLSNPSRWKVLMMIMVMAIWTWSIFSPLTYAGTWTRRECELAKWRRSWDFSCNEFFESRSDYENDGRTRAGFEWRKNGEAEAGEIQAATIKPVGMLAPIPNAFEAKSNQDVEQANNTTRTFQSEDQEMDKFD
ncbi:hypothetical protein O181_018003 [Austropuccinia psidii MF-1]|uniref:Dolichyl-phosphate-mannose--protein mannosyltransferase n=1 Tax=Austropuccinia psidii MF-1 TaxID=1389203 RepID=A0A9Q3C877_9BASI|nr:hypothetical protein [Austropuccinia psidii MF-1]